MKSFVVETLDLSRLVEIEAPEPAPASGEAVIDVRASTVNRGELSLLASRDKGWAPGQDVAGVVISQAADGSGPRIGERVVGLAEQGSPNAR